MEGDGRRGGLGEEEGRLVVVGGDATKAGWLFTPERVPFHLTSGASLGGYYVTKITPMDIHPPPRVVISRPQPE
jgi:hypothetical protein